VTPEALVERAAAAGTVLFLSAHLDDAVLSCGALMSRLVRTSRVVVVTVFSAAGPPPHTLAARSFLRQCAATGAAELYEGRHEEDAEVLRRLGAEHLHLDVPDALFRRRAVPAPVARLGRVVPELVHRYPTFRFDIDRGRVSRGDRVLVELLQARVRRIAEEVSAGLVFCPIGVGRHVDHLLTRSVGEGFPGRVAYYSDFPYNQVQSPDHRYVSAHRLQPCTWDDGLARKLELIRGYRTQVDALFPTGEIAVAPEVYFLPSA
jgi:LmbE family N-acetylglucosaminyl deacetylase